MTRRFVPSFGIAALFLSSVRRKAWIAQPRRNTIVKFPENATRTVRTIHVIDQF